MKREKLWYYGGHSEGLVPCEVIKEKRTHLIVKVKQGKYKGKTKIVHKAAANAIYPRLFESSTKPNLWRHKNRLMVIHPDSKDETINDMVPELDEGYIFQKKVLGQTIDLIYNNDRIMLTGEKGTGKTSLVEQIASRINQPTIRINLNGETRIGDFLGKIMLVNGETVWFDGVLPRAMRYGFWLILDEIDHGDPNILSLLHPILEKNGKLVLKENNGEVITSHPNFRVFATANSVGVMSDREAYAGVNEMNEAFLDRWSVLYHPDLDDDDRYVVIRKKYPHIQPKNARKINELIKMINEDESGMNFTLTTRGALAFAEKLAFYRNPFEAAEVTFLSKVGVTERTILVDLIRIVFGKKGAN